MNIANTAPTMGVTEASQSLVRWGGVLTPPALPCWSPWAPFNAKANAEASVKANAKAKAKANVTANANVKANYANARPRIHRINRITPLLPVQASQELNSTHLSSNKTYFVY